MPFISATETNRHFSKLLCEDDDATLQRMIELMEEGLDLGYSGPFERDEAHRR